MSMKYLDMVPKNCKDKTEGVCRAVIIEDMINHGTYFFAQTLEDNTYKLARLSNITDILTELYNRPTEPMFIWNKSLEDQVGLFNFNKKNEKYCMLVKMNYEEKFRQTILRKLNEEGGDDVAKICPKDGNYVLYLDCLECEDKAECKNKGKEEK